MTGETLNEIREINLLYLLLAQRLSRADPADAMLRLGVNADVVNALAKMPASQIIRLSNSSVVLCRLRFDDVTTLSSLTRTHETAGLSEAHAAILLTQQQAESLR